MQHNKAFAAGVVLQDDQPCGDAFEELIECIEAMPTELRGAHALKFSAHLLELAAFELAGDVNSDQVGALIQCAAELSERSADVAASKISGYPADRRFLQ